VQSGIGELEALFAKSKSKADVKVLKQIENELQYRQTSRAVALLAAVQAAVYGSMSTRPSPLPPEGAKTPRKKGLSERAATPPIAGPIVSPREANQGNPDVGQAISNTQHAPSLLMPVEDAYKLLKVTVGSTWESVEQSRRQLVQQSHPARLKTVSPERRSQALIEAKMVNSAYAALSRARCQRI
jgi:DnaJ-domain-containing protein 1